MHPSEAARDTDTLRLLSYGYGLYRRAAAGARGATLATANVDVLTATARWAWCPRAR